MLRGVPRRNWYDWTSLLWACWASAACRSCLAPTRRRSRLTRACAQRSRSCRDEHAVAAYGATEPSVSGQLCVAHGGAAAHCPRGWPQRRRCCSSRCRPRTVKNRLACVPGCSPRRGACHQSQQNAAGPCYHVLCFDRPGMDVGGCHASRQLGARLQGAVKYSQATP